MFIEQLDAVLRRDLNCLKRQLEHYPDEKAIWRTAPGITNSAGTLALHMVGNLRHFIGAQFGATGYVRDRDAEFNRRDVPRAELLALVDQAITDLERALPNVDSEVLESDYPLKIANATLVTADFLMHLAAHLTYHLGQVDYHRRFVTGQAGKVNAVSPLELTTARM